MSIQQGLGLLMAWTLRHFDPSAFRDVLKGFRLTGFLGVPGPISPFAFDAVTTRCPEL